MQDVSWSGFPETVVITFLPFSSTSLRTPCPAVVLHVFTHMPQLTHLVRSMVMELVEWSGEIESLANERTVACDEASMS